MKNNTLLMLGIAGIAIYYFMSQQSGTVQIAPSPGLPYGGYSQSGHVYAYDENGNTRMIQ